MDNLKGFDPFAAENTGDEPDYASFDNEDSAIEPPPVIPGDERRMQVRAYNFWTSQLRDKNYPDIEELDPETVDDFKRYSVLLDFSLGIENPSIQYLGEDLRAECGLAANIGYLDQVPPRSLLSRITDHYLQIIANRAPIGFEAEFINDRDVNIMYRGILLPYSSDGDTIDFIYGVINWKETAETEMSDSITKEVEVAIATAPPRQEHVPAWADGPTIDDLPETPAANDTGNILELNAQFSIEAPAATEHPPEEETPDEHSSLDEWLHAARSSASTARDCDARSREVLYQAIGRAYDFSLIVEKSPEEYAKLLEASGMTVQERAPMTPIVKLVFGADYDKTRLTEFSAALNYAHRNAVPIGEFSAILGAHDGGLKGIVKAERQARKVAKGEHVTNRVEDPRIRLRTARPRALNDFAQGDDEFVILVARREPDGNLAVIGTVDGDTALTEKALAKTQI